MTILYILSLYSMCYTYAENDECPSTCSVYISWAQLAIHHLHSPLAFLLSLVLYFPPPGLSLCLPSALLSSHVSYTFLSCFLTSSRCPALPPCYPDNSPIEKDCCLGHMREAAFTRDGKMVRSRVFSSEGAGAVIFTVLPNSIKWQRVSYSPMMSLKTNVNYFFSTVAS